MESHSNILVWEIPWTDEPGGLYSPWGRKELDTTELNMKKLNMHLLGWWIKSWATDDWFNLQLFSLPWKWGWKFHLSTLRVGSPSFGTFQMPSHWYTSGRVERDLLWKTKAPLSPLLLRKFQGFHEPCARNWDKDQIHISLYKYVFLHTNHNITYGQSASSRISPVSGMKSIVLTADSPSWPNKTCNSHSLCSQLWFPGFKWFLKAGWIFNLLRWN